MSKELTNPIRIRLDVELDQKLSALATKRGESKSELCRRLLRQAVEQETMEEVKDPILLAVRQAVQETLKPVEERLAKINAKTAIAAATGMYMDMQVYNEFGKDSRALYEAARKQAVTYLKNN